MSNTATLQPLQDELNTLISGFPANCHERYQEELRALLAATATQVSQLGRAAALAGGYGAPSVAALPKRKRIVK